MGSAGNDSAGRPGLFHALLFIKGEHVILAQFGVILGCIRWIQYVPSMDGLTNAMCIFWLAFTTLKLEMVDLANAMRVCMSTCCYFMFFNSLTTVTKRRSDRICNTAWEKCKFMSRGSCVSIRIANIVSDNRSLYNNSKHFFRISVFRCTVCESLRFFIYIMGGRRRFGIGRGEFFLARCGVGCPLGMMQQQFYHASL